MAAVQTLKEFCLSIGHDDEEFLAEIDKEEYVSVTISDREIILTAEEDQSIRVKAALGFVNFNQPKRFGAYSLGAPSDLIVIPVTSRYNY